MGAEKAREGFGTFQGVFRPTFLTILGALMYLREGWVVGHAGLGGFALILCGMYLITTTTALSMASITTNIRIGQGGVFSIICQSMGLEAGGAIGVPFYLAQALGGALYLFAFAEGWRLIFPSHPLIIVAITAYFVVLGLSLVGSWLAFRTQGVVLLGVAIALASAALALRGLESPHVPAVFSPAPDSPSLRELFALFFPAATGVLVGASMSGSLQNPRRSIRRGTLLAIGLSFVIYLGLAVWFSVVASPAELRADTFLLVKKAAWGPGILIGLLASTFSASISSFVAAPRVLQALGSFRILPWSEVLQQVTPGGEPRYATMVTALIVGLGLMAGSLDAIAPVLTVFFLITYASINAVVLVEQSLGMPSFRPTFKIPLVVPLAGFVASVLGILATSPIVGLIALGFVVAIYVWLVSRRLETPFETARSGLFVNLAGWAARRVAALPESTERSWKPDLLMPAQTGAELAGAYRLVRALVGTRGSIKLVGLSSPGARLRLEELASIHADLKADGVYASRSALEVNGFGEGVAASLSIMQGVFFPPNILFLSITHKEEADLQRALDSAVEQGVGACLYAPHPEAGLGRERAINLWIRDQERWELSLNMGSLDLSLLVALQIAQSWGARLRLICVTRDEPSREAALRFLQDLEEEARIPNHPELIVVAADLQAQLLAAPRADLNLFGLSTRVELAWIAAAVEATQSSCLFVRPSGKESALA
jgi:amino acid transporter